MIKITAPSQSFGSGLMQGFQAGAAVTPTPQELQESQLRSQLLQGQVANIPLQNKIAQAQLAVDQQRAQIAAQNTLQAKMAAINNYFSGQSQPVDPNAAAFQQAMNTTPQLASIGNLIPSQNQMPNFPYTSMPSNNNLSALIGMPSSMATGTSAPSSSMPMQSSPLMPSQMNNGTSSPTLGGLTQSQAMQALIQKTLGIPVTDPTLQARRQEQINASQAQQRGTVGQLRYLANASDEELKRLGLTPGENTRQAYATQIYKSLPPRQQNQMISSPDFIEHFNQQLKPMTEQFVKDLNASGIKASGKLTEAKLLNLIGHNNTLYDEYQNVKKSWQAAVSDYRSGLGDNATNYQTKYIDQILSPDFSKLSMGGQLKVWNNLLKYSDISVHDVINNSPLIDVKDHIPYHAPNYFEIDKLLNGGKTVSIPSSIKTKEQFVDWLLNQPLSVRQQLKEKHGD